MRLFLGSTINKLHPSFILLFSNLMVLLSGVKDNPRCRGGRRRRKLRMWRCDKLRTMRIKHWGQYLFIFDKGNCGEIWSTTKLYLSKLPCSQKFWRTWASTSIKTRCKVKSVILRSIYSTESLIATSYKYVTISWACPFKAPFIAQSLNRW